MIEMPSTESAAERARWLAEIASALEEARQLVRRLAVDEGRMDAIELAVRIDAARVEVRTLRLMRSSGSPQDFGPDWSKDIPWKLSA